MTELEIKKQAKEYTKDIQAMNEIHCDCISSADVQLAFEDGCKWILKDSVDRITDCYCETQCGVSRCQCIYDGCGNFITFKELLNK